MIAFKDWLTRCESRVLAPVTAQGSPVQRALHRLARVLYAVGRDLAGGTLTLHAMSLVYTTLLSVVPLLALSFSVLKALGVHNQLEPLLFQFVEPLGPQGEALAQQVLGFVDNMKVGVLGSLGLALLVYTVVSLVQKIERSFNLIWQVPQMRSLPQRFSNYLSVILVGPLLMVSAIGVTATVMASDVVQQLILIEPFGSLMAGISRLMPFLLVVMAFSFVYVFIPNTRVRASSALLGGLIAGLAWQGGGMLFASFVVRSAKYEAIYSSFAIGIVLLIWVYVSWLILLVGASLSYYAQTEGTISRRRVVRSSPALDERLALTMLVLVARPFDRGEPLLRQAELEATLAVPATLSRDVCEKLMRAGLLRVTGEQGDQLVPGRSIDQLSVADILAAVRADEEGLLAHLPTLEGLEAQETPAETSLAALVRR